MKIVSMVGARPNFMKVDPLIREFKKVNAEHILVHTGQHYDENMSRIFFTDLELPVPDVWLGIGPNSPAVQFARIIERCEQVLKKENPDLVIVVGDVTSTAAGAITASTLNIPVAHVEAGLRSFDHSMPEEINRILTDHIAELLFATEPSAEKNLLNEGIPREKIHLVGNVMIDTLLRLRPKFEQSMIMDRLQLEAQAYAVLTLHRPSNVDDKETFAEIIDGLVEVSEKIPIIFPVHPRTEKNLKLMKIPTGNIRMLPPLGYLDFMKLFACSEFILTDSGGIQEEATVLGVPCLTLRQNTERPITVSMGTNRIVGVSKKAIVSEAAKIIEGEKPQGSIPPLWDGKTAERIAKIILDYES